MIITQTGARIRAGQKRWSSRAPHANFCLNQNLQNLRIFKMHAD